jgi:hypothetical protein
LTEIGLIFIIRTRGKFWKAKTPSFWLIALTVIDGIFVVVLPFLKIGESWFHFVMVPIIPLMIVLLEVVVYYWVSEFVKLIYFHYWRPSKN